MALISTFTGAPSTTASPANLFSKISDVSLKEEGTGLYTITIQSTSQPVSKSLHVQYVSISDLTVRDVPITVRPDFLASTALVSSQC